MRELRTELRAQRVHLTDDEINRRVSPELIGDERGGHDAIGTGFVVAEPSGFTNRRNRFGVAREIETYIIITAVPHFPRRHRRPTSFRTHF